jgi:site-specific recombinase XerD
LRALKAAKHLKGNLVFCQADGEPLTLFMLHGALIRAARKAGLRLLRWHDLRHSFASNLTKNGTPLKQVQEWMGHSTITMTMRYAHLAPHGGREHLAGLTSTAPGVSKTA